VVLVEVDGDRVLLRKEYALLSSISFDDVVDDEEDGEFDLVSDELDPNSTISTSVCKVSDIP